jgi:glycosyltransferase involved in cell wall biosynthesis
MSKNIKLSILIPTHDRPEQLQKCLLSICKANIQITFEIIINCDDNSIKDINFDKYKLPITIYNNNFSNWGQVYNFLYKKAKGEYIYYLEDDDILLTSFNFDLVSDYYFGLYYPNKRENSTLKRFRNSFKKIWNYNHFKLFNYYSIPEKFEHFQLGQLIIKKGIIRNFPKTDDKYNDYYLFFKNIGTIKYINKLFYKQGESHYNVS